MAKGYKLWKTITVGADTVKVWKVKGFSERTGCDGDCSHWMRRIRIDADLSKKDAARVLIHEWYHYFCDSHGIEDSSEHAVSTFEHQFWATFGKWIDIP